MTTGALGVSWVKYYCRYHKEGRQLFMVPCEQKNTTKQVKKPATASAHLNVYLICYCFCAAGPHAAHAQVLHPTEVRLHRQALLLWRGDKREVSTDKDMRRGSSRELQDQKVNRWPTRKMCEGKMDCSPKNPRAAGTLWKQVALLSHPG